MARLLRAARGTALKILLGAAALLLSPSAALAGPVDRWASEIALASSRFGVPETWIREVIRAESNGETRLHGQPIVSRAGAMGLMQLMPATWRDMRALLGLGSDPNDPADNILAGTAYLRMMYDRFGYPGLFAAYNAGPARYAASLSNVLPLPAETRAYVAAVAVKRSPSTRPSPPPISLFAVRRTGAAASDRSPPSQAGLFVVLSGPANR